jgi:hypothetical protein
MWYHIINLINSNNISKIIYISIEIIYFNLNQVKYQQDNLYLNQINLSQSNHVSQSGHISHSQGPIRCTVEIFLTQGHDGYNNLFNKIYYLIKFRSIYAICNLFYFQDNYPNVLFIFFLGQFT